MVGLCSRRKQIWTSQVDEESKKKNGCSSTASKVIPPNAHSFTAGPECFSTATLMHRTSFITHETFAAADIILSSGLEKLLLMKFEDFQV